MLGSLADDSICGKSSRDPLLEADVCKQRKAAELSGMSTSRCQDIHCSDSTTGAQQVSVVRRLGTVAQRKHV